MGKRPVEGLFYVSPKCNSFLKPAIDVIGPAHAVGGGAECVRRGVVLVGRKAPQHDLGKCYGSSAVREHFRRWYACPGDNMPVERSVVSRNYASMAAATLTTPVTTGSTHQPEDVLVPYITIEWCTVMPRSDAASVSDDCPALPARGPRRLGLA